MIRIAFFSIFWLTFSLISGFAQSAKNEIFSDRYYSTCSPYVKLLEIPIEDIILAEGFWAQKFNLIKEVTIPKMFEYMHSDSSSHWRNFLIAAEKMEGEWFGRYWNDGDFYKWLESVVYVYQVTKDTEYDRLMDTIIETVEKVQAPDGYLSLYNQMNHVGRFHNKQHHELYNMGHLMTVSARHYQATGKTTFLNVGIKTADYLYETFVVDRPGRLNPFGFNPSNIMGAIDIYRVTGDRKYLALADTFVSMRGTTIPGKTISKEEYEVHRNPPAEDQNQDRVPFRKETEVVGHGVSGLYLYIGAEELFMETGEHELHNTNLRLWNDLVTRKIEINGAPAPVERGLSIRRDKLHEAFARAYELPLRDAYNETCANIANVMWNWSLYKAQPEVKYLDVLELSLYNSALSGLGLDGFSFYYTNPLRRYNKDVPLFGENLSIERSSHLSCYCCPPQLARHITGLRHYIYSVSKDMPELWVNLYAAGHANITLSDKNTLTISQKTNYPWEGSVEIEVTSRNPVEFTINLPIPGWAEGAEVNINGEPVSGVKHGEFVRIHRVWENTDRVSVYLPMRVRLMKSNPLIEQTRNQVAIFRGPVLYCLESVDLPEDIYFMDVYLKQCNAFTTEYLPELLGGIQIIKTKALVDSNNYWSGNPYNADKLYVEADNEEMKEIEIRLIPYFGWSNRGSSEMTVWLPVKD
jgi:DUF1680 family protein